MRELPRANRSAVAEWSRGKTRGTKKLWFIFTRAEGSYQGCLNRAKREEKSRRRKVNRHGNRNLSTTASGLFSPGSRANIPSGGYGMKNSDESRCQKAAASRGDDSFGAKRARNVRNIRRRERSSSRLTRASSK